MLGSVGLHVAVLASLVGAPISELPPPPAAVELVAFTVMGTEAMSPRPREIGPSLADAPAPAPAPAAEVEETPPPDPAPAPEPRAKPRKPEPSPEPQPPAPDNSPQPDVEPEPAIPEAPAVPTAGAPEQSDGTGSHGGGSPPDRPHDGAAVANAQGTGASKARGGGSYDSASYGKEIVRLVLDELDLDPVPGLKRSDSIRVLLRVRPDGSLAWPGSGRYGFALVLGTTLGPVRTRAILKRIERASARFPAYPLKRRRDYDIEVTIKFTRTLARG